MGMLYPASAKAVFDRTHTELGHPHDICSHENIERVISHIETKDQFFPQFDTQQFLDMNVLALETLRKGITCVRF
jgi:hypothetical protein